jgi:DNA-directed RNA polymerase subunit RPC12/RpoP
LLVGEGDSRQQTEEQLRELRQEERDLYDSLENHNETLKSKILRIAQVIEERINLLDPMLPKELSINQISSIITRQLRAYNMPFAHWVSEYLPDKYKNPNIHKHTKLIIDLKDLIDASVQPTELIEQSSNIQLDSLVQYIDRAKNINDDLGTLLNSRKEIALQEAVRRGMKEIAGEKIRDSISARDYRFEIPDDAELAELNAEVIKQGERVLHEYDVFIHEKYPVYPATIKEKARQYGNSFRVYANMIAIINEEKWSGDVDFWLDRNYWKKVQSSHKSGNSTMFPTTLCLRCSKDIDENPKDFHVTKYDKTSPTGYRCDNCGSIEIDDRFTSREQVGDKGPEVDRMASDIVNHIEHYVDIFKDVRINNMNPAIQARKRAISNKFRIASMGKEEIVVPRKKNSKQ